MYTDSQYTGTSNQSSSPSPPTPSSNTVNRTFVHRPSPTPKPTSLDPRHQYVQHPMDPASAIIGIVSFGFTVFKEVNKLRKAIRDAPDHVQSLQDSCDAATLLLSPLQVSEVRALSCSPDATRYLQALCERTNVCLMEINAAVKNFPSGESTDGHTPTLRRRKWLVNRGRLDDLTEKMMELRKDLCDMLGLLHT